MRTTAKQRMRIAALATIALMTIPATGVAEGGQLAPPFDEAFERPGACFYHDIPYPGSCSRSVSVDAATGEVELEAEIVTPSDGELPGLGDWAIADGHLRLTRTFQGTYDTMRVDATIDVSFASALLDTTLPIPTNRAVAWAAIDVHVPACGCDVEDAFLWIVRQEEPGSTSLSDEQLTLSLLLEADGPPITGDIEITVSIMSDTAVEAGVSGRGKVTVDATVSSVTATLT